jgi:DNA-binding ferritin-like protein
MVCEKLGFKLTFTNKEMNKDYLAILNDNVISDYSFDYQIFHNIVQGENFKENNTKLEELELELEKLVDLKAPTKNITNKSKMN